jgi:hypothetical protein
MRTYYTYAYLRENGTPYYIGKGSGKRAWSPKNRSVGIPADPSRILILKNNLTEKEAFLHECYMIFVLGRKNNGTGILRNKTDGGEGPTGYRHKPETLDLIGDANRRRVCSEKTRAKLSKNFKGKKHSPETLERLSKSKKGRPSHHKGKKWWVHPTGKCIQASKQPGPEWIQGMKWKNSCSGI